MNKLTAKKEVKRGKGQPRSFANENEFLNRFIEYLDECSDKKKMPNIAGFCWYCKITRETFYKQNEYYSDAFKRIQEGLEDAALQTHTAMGIFYLKNKFGYTDKKEVEQLNVNADVEMTEEEADRIIKKFSGT